MYNQLCSWENLLLAYRKAAKGKRGLENVAAFEYQLEENLLALQSQLLTQTYQPGDYSSFYIHEPKRRLISAAPFRDRVVHHALCNLIEPIFERSFIGDSYANRRGKGTHRALDRVQEYTRKYPYVLQCDIQQFFPSIDHAILRKTLATKVDDPRVLWLIDQILASGANILSDQYKMVYFRDDDLFAVNRHRGLPIGNLTSQFWANCYLNPFDHFIKRELQCPAYVRYVDDFLLFCNNSRLLLEWQHALVQRLANFRLTIHPGSQARPVVEGVPFLGFLVFPQRRRLKQRKGIYFQRKLRKLFLAFHSKQITFPGMNTSVQGWINHVRFANTIGLRKSILQRTSRHTRKQSISKPNQPSRNAHHVPQIL